MKTEVNTDFFYRGNDILKIWEKFLLKKHNIKFYFGRTGKTIFSEQNPLSQLVESAILLKEDGDLCKITGRTVTISGEIDSKPASIENALLKIFKQLEHFSNISNNSVNLSNHIIIFPYHITPVHWALGTIQLKEISNNNGIFKANKVSIKIYDSLCENDNGGYELREFLTNHWPTSHIELEFNHTAQQQDITSCGAITAENGKMFLTHNINVKKFLALKITPGARELREKHIKEIDLETFAQAQRNDIQYTASGDRPIDDQFLRADLIGIIRDENNSWVKDLLKQIISDRINGGNPDGIKLLKEFIVRISDNQKTYYIQRSLLKSNLDWQDGAIDLCLSLLEDLDRKEEKLTNLSASANNNSEESDKKVEVEYHNEDYKLNIKEDAVDWSQKTTKNKREELIRLSKEFNDTNTKDLDLLSCLNKAFKILDNLDTNIFMRKKSTKVILIGATGVGKTTISHYLESDNLVGEEGDIDINLNIANPSPKEFRTIGNSEYSETFYPNSFKIEGLKGYQIIDLAGVWDNNGVFIKIANDYAKKKYFGGLSTAKILFVLPYSVVTEKDFSATIELFAKAFVKKIENIDPNKVFFSCIINQVPSKTLNRANPTELVKNSLIKHLQANRNNIAANLYEIMERNFQNIALMSEAVEIGPYNIPNQRENLVKFVANTNEVDLEYFFEQETYDTRDFIEKLKNLDVTYGLIKHLKKKIHLALNNLEIIALKNVINYCKKADNLLEILSRLQKVKIFEDKDLILIVKRQEYFIKTIRKAQKYFLNSEIEEIISKAYDELKLVLSDSQNYLDRLDNLSEINTSIYENTITIKASYITTESIRLIVSSKTKQNINHIKVFAYAINFNCSLRFPSKDFFIKAYNYKFNNPITFDLSGLDANDHSDVNLNSGHFFLDISRFKRKLDHQHKLENLTLITNGGYGFNGKDGKKGSVGQNIMHKPGNESRAENSLFSNKEQIEILNKLRGRCSSDAEYSKNLKNQIISSLDTTNEPVLGKIMKISLSMPKKHDDWEIIKPANSNSIENIDIDSLKHDFLDFTRLPKKQTIDFEISMKLSLFHTKHLTITLNLAEEFKNINAKFYLSDYKRSSGFYKNALKKLKKYFKLKIRKSFNNALKIIEEKITDNKISGNFTINISNNDAQFTSSLIKTVNGVHIDYTLNFQLINFQIRNFLEDQLEHYLNAWDEIEDHYITAYENIIISNYQNLTLKNQAFPKLLDKDALAKDVNFDSQKYPALSSDDEFYKLECINSILDVLLREADKTDEFINSLLFMQWDIIYKKLLTLWSDPMIEKEKANSISLSSSLLKMHNGGYLFNEKEILEFFPLNVPAEKSIGRKVADTISKVVKYAGGLVSIGGVGALISIAAGVVTGGITVPIICAAGGGVIFLAGLTTQTQLDRLESFAFEIRSTGPNSNCYGNKGDNGENGGVGGNSGECIILLPAKQSGESNEISKQGKIGVGGRGGKGGENGDNGLIEYLFVARKYVDITIDDLSDEMIQLGHFYSRLPKNYDGKEYQKYLANNHSKDGRQGNHGQEIRIPQDLKEEFIQIDLQESLRHIEENEYNLALMGEEFEY